MNEEIQTKDSKQGKKKFEIQKYITKKVLGIIILVLAITSISLGIKTTFSTDSKTTKLGFEDIGELATQVAYCSEVSLTDKARKLFGFEIPFTQTKYVYSYDTVIKAGIDFDEVTWKLNESKKSIQITMPKAKILSNEIDLDSLKIYHEQESIFTPVSISDNKNALTTLKLNAEKDAIKNGLLENAEANAQDIMKGFIGQVYDLDEYEVKFSVK